MNTFSKLYLALLGLFPWKYVPTIPCEVLLIGKWFHVNFWEMSNWSRAMLVPLAIINHFKPTRPLKNSVNLDELYPEGIHERDLALPPDPERFTWRNFFLWLDRLHKFAEVVRPERDSSVPANARLRKASNGCWNGSRAPTGWRPFSRPCSIRLIALKALGYPDDHPQVVRAERRAEEARARDRRHACASSPVSRRSGTRPSWRSACANPACRPIIRR